MVVKAIERCSGKKVAIKGIANIFQANYIAKKVLREMHLMRRLTQLGCPSSICALLDVVAPPLFDQADHNYLFLVMDYMPWDLKKVVETVDRTHFGDKHLLRITYGILCALNFLHSADILHRDIKPSNILVDNQFNVKICDFGLSRVDPNPIPFLKAPTSEEERLKLSHTLSKSMECRNQRPRALSNHVVTRSYRPPEIIVQEKEYHSKVDMWSLGCMLAELVGCTRQYAQAGIKYSTTLFKGSSCFPLSPIK